MSRFANRDYWNRFGVGIVWWGRGEQSIVLVTHPSSATDTTSGGMAVCLAS